MAIYVLVAVLSFLAGATVMEAIEYFYVDKQGPNHQHNFSKHITGHYDSITGPRTTILVRCNCGKHWTYTVRGFITDSSLL